MSSIEATQSKSTPKPAPAGTHRPGRSDATSSRFLAPAEVSLLLGVSTKTLSNWRTDRSKPAGPPYHRIGSRIRYREDTLMSWLAQSSTGTAGPQ